MSIGKGEVEGALYLMVGSWRTRRHGNSYQGRLSATTGAGEQAMGAKKLCVADYGQVDGQGAEDHEPAGHPVPRHKDIRVRSGGTRRLNFHLMIHRWRQPRC